MAITVRPPLVFLPNPRPKWWGINPDAAAITATDPLPQDVVFTYNRAEGVPPPKRLPPPIPWRMVGPQRPFKFYPLEILPKRVLPESPQVNLTASLPTAPTQPLNYFDGFPPPKKLPPHMPLQVRSQPPPSSLSLANAYAGVPKPKALPPHMPVRVESQISVAPTNLAQAQLEFDPTGMGKKYPPDNPIQYPIVLAVSQTVVAAIPRTREYGTKPKWVWPEEAAAPNVAAQPPLIGIAQALDDFSPTGPPKKQLAGDFPLPNVTVQPSVASGQQPYSRAYGDHSSQWRKAYPYPDDSSIRNVVANQPPTVAPTFSYDYPSVPRKFWTIEAAPQDFWALPNTAIAPALYDYPALPAKKWPGDYFPFTNWVQETPPLPPGLVPPARFDWPKHLTLTLDDFQNPNTLQPPPTPIYIPEIGHEIYIPFRRFTIATPVRTFSLSVLYRAFTVSRKTVQTFDVKDPAESWPLTFNMGPDLFAGETLVGPPSVTVTLLQGTDPNPPAILNGVAGFDQTFTQVIQPVTGGIAGCAYELIVTCPTSNPQKTLTLVGVLPVQRS